MLALLICYSHYEIGLFKAYYKTIELHYLYTTLSVGLLHSTFYLKGELSTLLYLFPLNMMMLRLCDWVVEWKKRRIQVKRFVIIEDIKDI